MKKSLIIIIVSVLITILVSVFFFSKTNDELSSMFSFLGDKSSKGTLSITSPNGIAEVELNDELAGETPLTLNDLKAGNYKVKLTRKSSQELAFYDEHVYYVSIEPSTEAIINIEIGPNDNVHGYILYYEDISVDKGKGTFSINGNPEEIEVKLEGESVGKSPFYSETLSKGEYRLKFLKDKYESLEFPVNIVDGYNLNITTYLMPIPINIETEVVNEEQE